MLGARVIQGQVRNGHQVIALPTRRFELDQLLVLRDRFLVFLGGVELVSLLEQNLRLEACAPWSDHDRRNDRQHQP